MAFQINMPAVPTYAGGQPGANVDTNPLSTLADLQTIHTSQQALKKAKATYGSDVELAKANAQKATTEAQKANLEFGNQKLNTVYTVISPYDSDERVLKASQITPQSSPEEIEAVKNGLLDIGEESIKELVARGIPKAEAYRMIAPHFMEAEADPRKAAQSIKMAVQKLAGAQNIASQNQPEYTTVGGVPGFVSRAKQQFTEIGGNQQNAPQQNAPQGNAPAQAAEAPSAEKIVRESFPNRRNTSYVSDTEKTAFDTGNKMVSEAKSIGDAANTQLNDIRQARKYLQAANGTKFGQGTRSMAQLLIANPDLESLIKTTAQIQMNSANRFNANTDAARETSNASQPNANISEKALARILDNAEADLLRDAKYASGMQKFYQKRGNVGGALNAADFKQAWTDNAKDRKLFQLIAINSNPEYSAKEKEDARHEILKHESKSTIEALTKQMKAMKRLEQGD
jgi:hypothetical protein